MPRRARAGKARHTLGGLTNQQVLELVIGPGGQPGVGGFGCTSSCAPPWRHDPVCPSSFDGEDDRRAAWWAVRDLVLEGRIGDRPWAWWRYEAGRPMPRNDLPEERRLLEEMGELSPAEIAQLRFWDRIKERNE
ncbi:hypothetical protein BH20ACT9_BH20ACT9_06060 [soil metagenome]